MTEQLVLTVTLIGVLGIGAQWLAWRLNLPAIVLMAGAGLLVGPVFGILHPEEAFGDFYEPIIQIAVAVILFEGGLQLKFSELRGLSKGISRLVILGGPIAWFLGALAGHYVAGLTWPTAILFAGIMIVTGPTVIMPLLRQAKLSSRPAAVLKWEGIVNDPVGALAAVIVFEYIRAQTNPDLTGPIMLLSLIIATALCTAWGVIVGQAIATGFRKGWVPEYLKSPVLLAAVLVAFSLSNLIQKEGGLLAVTAMGITMANARMPSINQLLHFKENIATVFIAGVFVILTANLTPDILAQLNWRIFAFVLVMLLVVRPISVLISTWKTELKMNERLMVSWIAPRGIVAVAVSGLFAVAMSKEDGFVDGELMVPLAFAMVFATVILHGFSIAPLGRILGLASTLPPGVLIVGASPWSTALAGRLKSLDVPVLISDSNYWALRRARQEGIPCYYGEVLSETTEHHVDFSRYGYVLALTGNESHNTLVCSDLAPDVGRSKTFQLVSRRGERTEEGRTSVSYTLQGQILMGGSHDLNTLIRRHWDGWVFQVTRLSEEFTGAHYLESLDEEAIVVVVQRKQALTFAGADGVPELQVGDRVVAFVPPSGSDQKGPERIAADAPSADPDRLPT